MKLMLAFGNFKKDYGLLSDYSEFVIGPHN